MKIWTSEYTFNHPWETVAQANLRKYPNPINTNVVGTDIIERKVIGGVLHTYKLVTSDFGFPKWAQAIIGSAKECYASERSSIDPTNKELFLRTRNLSFCNYIAVDETLRYQPDPTNNRKTQLTQEAVVMVRGVPLAHYMEDLLTNKISLNANKGREALEWVIERMGDEVKDLAKSAAKSTDELLAQTRRQFDDVTEKARKGIDELQNAAKMSFDEIQNLTVPPTPQAMPKL